MPHDLKRYETLIDILSYKRAASSFGELAMITRFIAPVPNIQRDDYGNFFVKVGTAPVLWSCHTDTVHKMDVNDREDIRQKLAITEDGLIITQNGSCLGADNSVGVWLMLELIKGGVEGLYVFHREEEIGAGGSSYFAKENVEILKDYKFAIAFDRRKTVSVITHQGGRKTCSNAFADSLIAQLGMDHIKDDGGSFTDTKNYVDVIPECTNVSAGFYNEHSFDEKLDIQYVGKLLDALLKMDLTQLVCERDPKKKEYKSWGNYHYSSTTYRGGHGHGGAYRHTGYYDDFDWEDDDTPQDDDEYLIQRSPEIVKELLEEWGILDAFMDEVRVRSIFGS